VPLLRAAVFPIIRFLGRISLRLAALAFRLKSEVYQKAASLGMTPRSNRTVDYPFFLDILLALSIMPESVFESVDPAQGIGRRR